MCVNMIAQKRIDRQACKLVYGPCSNLQTYVNYWIKLVNRKSVRLSVYAYSQSLNNATKWIYRMSWSVSTIGRYPSTGIPSVCLFVNIIPANAKKKRNDFWHMFLTQILCICSNFKGRRQTKDCLSIYLCICEHNISKDQNQLEGWNLVFGSYSKIVDLFRNRAHNDLQV